MVNGKLKEMGKFNQAEPKPESVDPNKVFVAKKAFFIALFDLSWKMLAAMLVPIFGGLYLDKLTGSDKKFAYVGFVMGIIATVLVIKSVVNRLSKEETRV